MTLECDTEDGITIGLVDALISICKVLASRDLSNDLVQEALLDLHNDSSVKEIF